MKSFFTLIFIGAVGFLSIAAVQTRQPSVQAVTASGSVANGATFTDDFAVAVNHMVSIVVYKTGAGLGNTKLQGSNDGSGWKDVNTTTYPGASGSFATGASTSMLSVEAFPWSRARFSYVNGGSGAAITGGKWISK